MAGHLRLTSVALPFLEGALDVVLGDETVDCFHDRNGHRDGRDQIIAGIGQGLALRGGRRDAVGHERTVVGANEPRGSFALKMALVDAQPLSGIVKEAILGGNLKRLLGN